MAVSAESDEFSDAEPRVVEAALRERYRDTVQAKETGPGVTPDCGGPRPVGPSSAAAISAMAPGSSLRGSVACTGRPWSMG
jgi:hypothetical protein